MTIINLLNHLKKYAENVRSYNLTNSDETAVSRDAIFSKKVYCFFEI